MRMRREGSRAWTWRSGEVVCSVTRKAAEMGNGSTQGLGRIKASVSQAAHTQNGLRGEQHRGADWNRTVRKSRARAGAMGSRRELRYGGDGGGGEVRRRRNGLLDYWTRPSARRAWPPHLDKPSRSIWSAAKRLFVHDSRHTQRARDHTSCVNVFYR
ncbi:hypothetical protein K469DRAFT_694831 [Zopfia rhizophila CBS 207.26]|uniref:Uncharacterized protein n=1 Tax=Zopfia rhizophila CBS 207.26 TaxID=1314779 RepID=A0A6A6EKU9_9PEZI|nr:hypothetical protein K469DRAFT_694831 [Zopfia rhizophila CBS 207.26]